MKLEATERVQEVEGEVPNRCQTWWVGTELSFITLKIST